MEILDKILDLYLTSWVAHWQLKGNTNLAIHHEIGDLYEELQDFADEYVETELTNGELITNIFPVAPRVKEVIPDPVGTVVRGMTNLRKDILLIKDPILADWCGRLITRLTHYIFTLGTPPATAKLFSTKSTNELVAQLRKLFHDQAEFVTIFNAWLKGKKVDPEFDSFFRANESELIGLSDTILSTNTELFSIRESFETFDDSSKSQYNAWVHFFDLFVD